MPGSDGEHWWRGTMAAGTESRVAARVGGWPKPLPWPPPLTACIGGAARRRPLAASRSSRSGVAGGGACWVSSLPCVSVASPLSGRRANPEAPCPDLVRSPWGHCYCACGGGLRGHSLLPRCPCNAGSQSGINRGRSGMPMVVPMWRSHFRPPQTSAAQHGGAGQRRLADDMLAGHLGYWQGHHGP
ncbi:hypothetical protein BS78_05G090000 [Paspalum vaginatum]|nr:hypothetical protein BS78_05G090000 [Paspalum vaginatum]